MIIVGAGITGCTIARILKDKGIPVTVYEQNKTGGNCRTKIIDGMEIHLHGAHTWHNSNKKVQEFMERFTTFRQYTHHKFICYKDKFYRIPINADTLKQFNHKVPSFIISENFENYLIQYVGKELYEIFYKNYTFKQWGTLDIPIEITKRIPVHTDNSSNYFHDSYSALPENYNIMFFNMLDGIKVIFDKFTYANTNETVIYTGAIDELFNYDMGVLSYRTIDQETELFEMNYYQPCGTLNYTDTRKHVRSIEHKHFNNHSMKGQTIVTFQTMRDFTPGDIPYYPMWDYDLYEAYKKRLPNNYILAGRLGLYQYLDMNIAVEKAMSIAEKLCS